MSSVQHTNKDFSVVKFFRVKPFLFSFTVLDSFQKTNDTGVGMYCTVLHISLGDVINMLGFAYLSYMLRRFQCVYQSDQWETEFLTVLQTGFSQTLREKKSLWLLVNFIYRRPTLYPLEIAVDFLKSL
jgi:hypothetical protein